MTIAIDQGVAALVGAVVGGGATLLGSLLTGRQSSESAKQAHAELVAATALLMQDDLYHFQVSIARGIDRCGWWTDAEVLAQQSTVEDRKTVWAALSDEPVDPAIAGECLPDITDMPGDLRSQAPISVTKLTHNCPEAGQLPEGPCAPPSGGQDP